MQIRWAVAQRDTRHAFDGFPVDEPAHDVGRNQALRELIAIDLFFEESDSVMRSLTVASKNERPPVTHVVYEIAKRSSHILIGKAEYLLLYFLFLQIGKHVRLAVPWRKHIATPVVNARLVRHEELRVFLCCAAHVHRISPRLTPKKAGRVNEEDIHR